jgi:hypothetical protein
MWVSNSHNAPAASSHVERPWCDDRVRRYDVLQIPHTRAQPVHLHVHISDRQAIGIDFGYVVQWLLLLLSKDLSSKVAVVAEAATAFF